MHGLARQIIAAKWRAMDKDSTQAFYDWKSVQDAFTKPFIIDGGCLPLYSPCFQCLLDHAGTQGAGAAGTVIYGTVLYAACKSKTWIGFN